MRQRRLYPFVALAVIAAMLAVPLGALAAPQDIPSKWCPAGYEAYAAKPGDTLYGLARQYKTTAGAIAGASGIALSSRLGVGQQLCVPSGATPAPGGKKPTSTTPTPDGVATPTTGTPRPPQTTSNTGARKLTADAAGAVAVAGIFPYGEPPQLLGNGPATYSQWIGKLWGWLGRAIPWCEKNAPWVLNQAGSKASISTEEMTVPQAYKYALYIWVYATLIAESEVSVLLAPALVAMESPCIFFTVRDGRVEMYNPCRWHDD